KRLYQECRGKGVIKMMFASCQKNMVIDFIRHFYPTFQESDSPKMMSLIDKDILRVTDPNMHGQAELVHGKKYDSKFDGEINEAVKEFKAYIAKCKEE
ncbi:MAG: hypothetical protein ACOC5T_08105, partial [Elusimicrobiota bacterium]